MDPVAQGSPEELGAFQRRYWAAWDACDLDAVAACLDPGFVGTFAGPAGAETVTVDHAGALALMAASFSAARGQRAGWRRSGILVLRRGPDDAAASLRVDCLFPERPQWNNSELTLEAYRRAADGRWRLVRACSERVR